MGSWLLNQRIKTRNRHETEQKPKGATYRTLKRQVWFAAGLALVLSLTVLPLVHAQGDKPTVQGFLFYSDDCPTCLHMRTEILPGLYKEFGQQLQIKVIDIGSDADSIQWFQDCANEYGISQDQADIPALFIGDKYLIGADEIENKLPLLIQEHLENGGVDFPDIPRPGGPLKPAVRFMFFYSPACPHCTEVEENLLPKIRAKYGDQVQWEKYDRSEEENYRALLILGELTGLSPDARGAVPLVFIGDGYSIYARFLGSFEINDYLEEAIEWYVQVGGADWPEWKDRLFDLAVTPFPQPVPEAAQTQAPTTEATATSVDTPLSRPIHLAYFEEAGCNECDAVSAALGNVQKRYPGLVVHKMDIMEDLEINLCLSERLNVPKNQRHDAPAVFVGSDYLVAKDVHYESLMQIVSKYAESGAEPAWAS